MSKHTPGRRQIGMFSFPETGLPAALLANEALAKAAGQRLTPRERSMLATLQAIVDEAGPQFGHDDGPGTVNRIARLARRAIALATKDQ